jgi:hypothetical protein
LEPCSPSLWRNVLANSAGKSPRHFVVIVLRCFPAKDPRQFRPEEFASFAGSTFTYFAAKHPARSCGQSPEHFTGIAFAFFAAKHPRQFRREKPVSFVGIVTTYFPWRKLALKHPLPSPSGSRRWATSGSECDGRAVG